MTDLMWLCNNVINALKDTDEYREYRETLSAMQEHPELMARVNEMRKKNYRLHMEQSEDLVDLVDALTNEYVDVINNELVGRFLSAEASFCKLFKDFNNQVVSGLEFD